MQVEAAKRALDPWAAVIAAAALGLRIARRSPVWPTSDAGDLPEFVRDRVCAPGHLGADLRELTQYRLGGVEPVVSYLQMQGAHMLSIRVSELGWELPSMFVGAIVVYLAFCIASGLSGRGAGLTAAALLAVSPLNIMESRHLGAPWMYEELLGMFALWVILRLHEHPSPSLAALPVVLGIHLWSGNQMMAIFPVVAYGVVAGARERPPGEPVARYLSKRYLTAWWILPALSAAVLAQDTFVLHKGHLFHALFEKRHAWGWYWDNWWQDVTWALGRIGVWLAAALILVSVTGHRRMLSLQRLPLVAFLAFTAPFLLTIPPGSTFTRGYIVHGVNALLLASAVALFRRPIPRTIATTVAVTFVAVLFAGAGQSAYALFRHPLLGTRNFHGAYVPNVGFKAAAQWVRSHAAAGDRVFSDASGGGGLEPPLVAMYFHLPYFAVYDARATEPYWRFGPRSAQTQFLVVQPKNRPLVPRYFGRDFREAAVITTPERGQVLSVFDRRHEGPPDLISSVEADGLFDRRYSLLCE